tara:strand:+ start:815 stop:1048 length:234 start_codon:yes stop_codon:yes gene_type:complete
MKIKIPKNLYTDLEIEQCRVKLISYLQRNYGEQYLSNAFIRSLAKENNIYHETLEKFINRKKISSGVLCKLVKKLND